MLVHYDPPDELIYSRCDEDCTALYPEWVGAGPLFFSLPWACIPRMAGVVHRH